MFKTPYTYARLFRAVQGRILMLFLLSFLISFASIKVSASPLQISNINSMKFLYENQSHIETVRAESTDQPGSEANSEEKNESEERITDFEMDEFLLHSFPIYFSHLKVSYSLEDLSLTLPPWVLLPLIPPNLI